MGNLLVVVSFLSLEESKDSVDHSSTILHGASG